MDGFAAMNHVFGYVVARQANYENDSARAVLGDSTSTASSNCLTLANDSGDHPPTPGATKRSG